MSVYRYIPVNQFTPLSTANWLTLASVMSGKQDDTNSWRFILTCESGDRSTGGGGSSYILVVEMISYTHNIFRIRFDPSRSSATPPDIVFGPVTQVNLNSIRTEEISNGAPSSNIFQFTNEILKFNTKDLIITIDANCRLTVQDNQGATIHQDAVDSHGWSLGTTFVDPKIGTAVASIKVNRKDDSSVKERFYGQGEVNVNVGGASGAYVLGKTGLAMTNFNYDQITYTHPELAPNVNAVPDPSYPNYYFPMYFSAPWIIVVGNQGKSNEYAYGLFLDNASQSYVNTGDEGFGPDVGVKNLFYMGAQSGELDSYFIFGDTQSNNPVGNRPVDRVVAGLSYLCSNPNQQWARMAAMPPKYVFGYFQGVYGAVGVNSGAYPSTYPKIDNAVFFEDVMNGYKTANIPLEGFAVDIDVQDTYKVFTINKRFFFDGDESGNSIFEWAQQNDLVTQTNITCFIKDSDSDYSVYQNLVSQELYTNSGRIDGGTPFKTDGHGPSDAYCGQLQYGENAKITAIFPDWGRSGVAKWWGENYIDLFKSGLNFVWQDMTTPSMDSHIVGNEVTDDSFNLDTIKSANSAAPSPEDTEYAASFNWRSYHLQVGLTDPRFGDGEKRSFSDLRNQHAFSLCSATYEQGIQATSESRSQFKRSYIIARGGQIGSQQFGGLWMGDNATDWRYLNLMIPMIVSMNISGLSVVGADIGGFAQFGTPKNPDEGEGYPPSPELLTRWIQAGFLFPWFRNHYDRWIGLDPSTSDDPNQWQKKGHGKPYQELYNPAYNMAASGSKSYQDAMREVIELRYRWQEILYTAAYRNVRYGISMIYPMCSWSEDVNIDYDAKPELNTQFLVGFELNIMAAPIVDEGRTNRTVYFPVNANWFPYFPGSDDDDIYQYQIGGVSSNVDADVSQVPIYIMKGAILPTRYTFVPENIPINSYTTDDPLVFDIFSAVEGSKAEIYLDDGGVTTDAENKGIFGILVCQNISTTQKSLKCSLDYAVNNFTWNSCVYLRLRAVGTVTSVTIDGQNISEITASDKYAFFKSGTITNAIYWIDSKSGSVWIRVPELTATDNKSITVTCSDTIDRSKPL